MRENGFRAIGGLAQRLSSDLARSHGGKRDGGKRDDGRRGSKAPASMARLRADWALIVGPELARVTQPERLLAGRAHGGRALRLRVAGAAALEVQHMSGQLVERVNAYFGHRFIEEIRLLQGTLPAAPAKPEPPRRATSDPATAARLAGRVAGVKDPELRAALARLGSRIATSRRSVLAGAVAGLLAPFVTRRAQAQLAGPVADGRSIPEQPQFSDQQKKLLTLQPSDHVLGKPTAPLVIIDYFSLTCPHCANFSAAVLPAIRSEWTDKGRACFIYRHWPFDTIATHASQLTECVGPAKFFDTIEILFSQQVEWLTAPDPDEEMVRILEKQGIKAGGCYAQDQLLDKIIDDVQSGQALGVQVTPTVFVNGLYVGSPNTAEGMGAILRQAAAR